MNGKYLFLLSTVVFCSAGSAGSVQYEIKDLGELHPLCISSSGEIGGYVLGSDYYCPAVMDQGVVRQVEAFGKGGYVYDINSSGLTVGWINAGAASWNAAGQATIMATASDGHHTEAIAANDNGVVVGSYLNQNWLCVACYWNNGVFAALNGPFGNQSTARSVNRFGAIAVDCWQSATFKSYVYKDGTFIPVLADMPTLSPAGCSGINDAGMLVGAARLSSGTPVAYAWQNGVTRLLATPPGEQTPSPRALNNSGVVVGYAWSPGSSRACVWNGQQAAYLEDLLSAHDGWLLQYANDINDSGQIVGEGLWNGVYHGYLLTPVPEPTSLALLVCAAVCWRLFRKGSKP